MKLPPWAPLQFALIVACAATVLGGLVQEPPSKPCTICVGPGQSCATVSGFCYGTGICFKCDGQGGEDRKLCRKAYCDEGGILCPYGSPVPCGPKFQGVCSGPPDYVCNVVAWYGESCTVQDCP